MIILGLDPGIATVGYGVVDYKAGKFTHIRHGTIKTAAGVPLSRRLMEISNDLRELISIFKPDQVAVEELFFSKNITTGISVAHGRGVLLLECARMGLPIYQYNPMQVKQAVTGYGAAEKKQVMEMTRMILCLEKVPRPDDAADALAVAICNGHSTGGLVSTATI